MLAKHLNRTFFSREVLGRVLVVPASESHLLASQITLLGKPRAVFPMTRKTENICSGMKQYFNLRSKVISKG